MSVDTICDGKWNIRNKKFEKKMFSPRQRLSHRKKFGINHF